MSLYSPDIYREAAHAWTGTGVVYLVLLLSLSWLPSPIRWFLQLREFSATTGRTMVNQMPVIAIHNGIMSAKPSGPHIIRTSDAPTDLVLVIDDSIDEVPANLPDGETIVLTRREIGTVRRSTGERRTWKLTPSTDMDLAPGEVEALLTSLPYWVPFVGYVASVAGSLIVRTLQILVYGWIGLLMTRKWNVALDYNSLLRIAALAVTPVVVLRTIIGPWEPAWFLRWPLAAAITIAYLSFGIRAAATKNTNT
jgi:hypothetical protein